MRAFWALTLWVLSLVPCAAQELGVRVETVRPDSVAAKAGIQVGDCLLSYNGKPLPSPFALQAVVENTFDTKEVPLRLQRGMEALTLTIATGKLGLTVLPQMMPAVLKTYQEGLAQSNAPEQAIARWKEAAQAAQVGGDASSAAWLWWYTGQYQGALGQWKEARASYESAWTLVKDGTDVAAQYSVLSDLGNCCDQLGDGATSRTCFEQSERTAEAASLLGWEGDALTVLGILAVHRRDLEAAQSYFQHALAMREKLVPDSLKVAVTLNSLGTVAADLGDLEAAQDYFHRGLVIREKLTPGSLLVALSLSDLGNVSRDLGDMEAAQDFYQRGLVIRKKLAPESLEVALSLSNLGNVALDLGDLVAAQNYFQHGLTIREKVAPGSLPVALSFNNLGLVCLKRSDLVGAQSYFKRALAIQEKLAPDSLALSASLSNLGIIAAQNSDLVSAQNYFQRTLEIKKRRSSDPLDIAVTFDNLGTIASERGDLAGAQGYFQQALAIKAKRDPDSLDAALSLANLGHVLVFQKHSQEALPLLLRAVDIVEKHRGHIASPDARALLLDQHIEQYDFLIDAYLDLNDITNAFVTLERKRARALTDQIAERSIDFSTDAPTELLAKQRTLDNQRRIAYHQRTRLDPDRDQTALAANDTLLASLAAQQRELTALLRKQSPHYAALVYPQPLDLKQVQQTLDPGTLLLEFVTSKDQTLLFAVTRTSLDLYQEPIQETDLQKQVARLREMLSQAGSLADYRPLARQLYDTLLRPAQTRIQEAKRLLLCPDGPLQVMPFCALIETLAPGSAQHERFLVEAKPLHTVVGMNVYKQLKQQPASTSPENLLALGNPAYPQQSADATPMPASFVTLGHQLTPLPRTADQVKAIAALFAPHALVHLGKEATRATVLSEGGKARILHFACHGLLDDRDPLASALALTPEGTSDDGLLRAYDILTKLHLHADLVVLSGCETGLGVQTKNEGIVGLTRAFEYAGARSVAVSLWELADTSSTALMEAFYRGLKAGKSKDEALRQAQLTLLHGKNADWREPFHWAAFQLVGDWK
jgi:CHAT domain-containing protein/Tfp pilus assembly protein PilF